MRKLVALLITALLITGVSAWTASAAKEPTRYSVTADDIREPREFWYGLYTGDKKIGFASLKLSRAEMDGIAGYKMDMEIRMKVVSMAKQVDMAMVFEYFYDPQPPFPMRMGRFSMKQEGSDLVMTVTRHGDGFKAVQVSAGQKLELDLPNIDYALADDLTMELFFRRGPKVGDEIAVHTFIIPELKLETEGARVKEIKEAFVDGVKLRYYDVEMSSGELENFGIARMDEQGRMLSGFFGAQIELRMEPEELARQIEYSADLFVLGMVKVDRPLGNPIAIKHLVLDVTGPENLELETRTRQVVEPLQGGGYRVTIGPDQPTLKAKPGEREENLKETVDYPISHPLVRDLARQAVGDARDDAEKVLRLAEFVDKFLEDAMVPENSTVFNLLKTKRGDCTEHALLFAALARAAGIPAREAGGLTYMGDAVQAFGGHAWDEVILDGQWVPVDTVLGVKGVNPTLLNLGDELSVFKYLGLLKIKVVDIRK